jgi:hypothetical protein
MRSSAGISRVRSADGRARKSRLRAQFVSAAILTTFRYQTYLIPSGLGFHINQRTNHLQRRLMLGISPSCAQKFVDIDIGQLAAGWGLGA